METENEWTMDSHDISAVGRAPSITFRVTDDRQAIFAMPPGGHITIVAVAPEAKRSRIVLVNMETSETFADIESTHVVAPSLGDAWNSATQHACEIAAVLYWGMWRRSQLRALGAEAKETT